MIIFCRVMEREPISIELEWQRPSQTYGDLIGYRLKHGVKDQILKVEEIDDITQTTYSFKDLGKICT